jgi:hypothetical protein
MDWGVFVCASPGAELGFGHILTSGETTVSNFSIENIGAFELNHATISVVDRALEATTHGPAPTSLHAGCYHIRVGDGALEASVGSATPTGNAWTQVCCRRIDDAAVEASAQAAPPMTMIPCPYRIDDGAN